MSDPSALSVDLAKAHRAALADRHFDVLVIGGGVVGAGIALDAATRGKSVALVEAQDFASGTSSRSSKLIHGGLRYVQTREFRLVREALRERAILLNIAPHLVRPARFLYPLRHHWERPYVGAGIGLYDVLARLPGVPAALPFGRHFSRKATMELAPALRADRLTGGVVYHDAQVDDARYVLAVVRTAVAHGAVVATRARVTQITEDSGRVVGAEVCLVEDGTTLRIRAGVTIAAAGVWTGELLSRIDSSTLSLRPSKGVHLVVPRDAIEASCALIIPTETSVLFVLPWGEHWIVGTTDTPWALGPAKPAASAADVDYLLDELNRNLRRPLSRDAIESVYVGLRPLIDGGAAETAELSREHAVVTIRPGFVAVTGGKYTTYRLMARDALDAALGNALPSVTDRLPILGALGYALSWARRASLAAKYGLPIERVERLLGRYGALSEELLARAADGGGLEPLDGAPGYLRAEFAYAVTHEGARHLDDLLVRRTRVAIETRDRGIEAASHVAELVAPLLGWSPEEQSAEVAAYRALIAAELRAESATDDDGAFAALDAATPMLPLP